MSTSADNKRRAARLHHELPIAFRADGAFLSVWATDISQGGLFINTARPLPVGTPLTMLLQLPGEPLPCSLSGRVTRVCEPGAQPQRVPGMGVEFTDLDPARRATLDRLVLRLRQDLDEA